MKSNFLNLNWGDALKGLIVAVLTSVFATVTTLIQTGKLFDKTSLPIIATAALTGFLGYLSKQFLTNSEGKFLTTEKFTAVGRAKAAAGSGAGRFRTIILIIGLSSFALSSSAQGLAFKPSPKDFIVKVQRYNLKSATLINQDSVISTLSKWTLATGVNAVSFNLKTGQFSALNAAGFGLIKAQYKLTSDKLNVYKAFSYGGMILFGDTNQDPLFDLNKSSDVAPAKTDVGIMAVGGVGPVSVGPTYFVVSKVLLLNFQVQFTF